MAINLNATINNVSENVKLLTDKNWEALEQRLSVVDNYQEDIQGKADKTYVDEELAKKHNSFEYGTGLNVNTVGANTTVSVKTGEISSANSDGFVTGAVLFNAFAQKADASVLATKQNALTPGIGVTIDGNNVISIKALVRIGFIMSFLRYKMSVVYTIRIIKHDNVKFRRPFCKLSA